MAMNQEEVESLADDSFATLEGEGSDGGSSTIPGERNTDRLRRNRESAKRCRLRRKEYIQGVESKCKILEDKNSTLTHENTRLQLLLDQLLAQNAQNGTPISFPDTDTIPCAKRIKIENGVTAADFNTESADTRHSQQQEKVTFPLAKATTILFLIASTHLISNLWTAVWTQAIRSPDQSTPNPSKKTCLKEACGLKTSTPTNAFYKHHPPIRWSPAAAAAG
eukprot:TRINITY_DN935_c0_g1_i2.p1 TRINITY_DN935_c0_g1~~TRINITY_DN935_c0_g1_i2.p1  ORF type:complete len:222 (+),score=22.69 TRINITY_DN935_c0_g1_i2:184-849(+)